MDRLVRRLLTFALAFAILDGAATGVVLGIVANGQSHLAAVQAYDHAQSVAAQKQARNGQRELAAIINQIEVAIEADVDRHVAIDIHQAIVNVERYFSKH